MLTGAIMSDKPNRKPTLDKISDEISKLGMIDWDIGYSTALQDEESVEKLQKKIRKRHAKLMLMIAQYGGE